MRALVPGLPRDGWTLLADNSRPLSAILESSVEPDHPTLVACRENLAALDEREEPAEAGSCPVG
jgi:hypothetical protein